MELVANLSTHNIYHPTGNLNYLEAARVSDEVEYDKRRMPYIEPRITRVSWLRRLYKMVRYRQPPAWRKTDIFTSILLCPSGDVLDVRFMGEAKRFRVYSEMTGIQ